MIRLTVANEWPNRWAKPTFLRSVSIGHLEVARYIARLCFESESLGLDTFNLLMAKVLCLKALKRFWIARTVVEV